jgi:hypothetical protein
VQRVGRCLYLGFEMMVARPQGYVIRGSPVRNPCATEAPTPQSPRLTGPPRPNHAPPPISDTGKTICRRRTSATAAAGLFRNECGASGRVEGRGYAWAPMTRYLSTHEPVHAHERATPRSPAEESASRRPCKKCG